MKRSIRLIDFFCGAGGFSEGFRQQGFKVAMGIDNWRPALQTHNLSHGLNDSVVDILEFENDIEKIDQLPNTEVIIGSPPCVNFSMSNQAGKADKSLGVRLIEAYLRVVAVKKHQPKSILKAWLMENVPNSRNYVKECYTFENLNLGKWAKTIGKKPRDEALRVKNNGGLYIAADFGSPQSRQRFICGEVVSTGKFPEPQKTHARVKNLFEGESYVTLGDIKSRMPSPFDYDASDEWEDPNYPGLKLTSAELTDQFYDTGVYTAEWELARFAKVNHPYMGRMSFPEAEDKPSRTIMATRSASTREALIFRSEFPRAGDGEYRLPTIREVATLMGFPFTYQFVGGEGSKWRQIGNAVCPHMAAALAKAIRRDLRLPPINEIDFTEQRNHYLQVNNLNAPGTKTVFNMPPKKKKGTKFRMHPFKAGNMTVSLTNFDPKQGSSSSSNGSIWHCTIFTGSGKEFGIVPVTSALYATIGQLVDMLPDGKKFKEDFQEVFAGRIGDYQELQGLLEQNASFTGALYSPTMLVNKIAEFITSYDSKGEILANVALDGIRKDKFPKRQILAAWAIGQIVYRN